MNMAYSAENKFAKNDGINKRNGILENAADGNFERVVQLIYRDGINIYKATAENETSLHLAMLNGHREIATILWDIYENDLKFIERSLQDCDHFWTKKPILIVFGAANISSFWKLYGEYQKWDMLLVDRAVNKSKCVVFLLKWDNMKSAKVLCLSPKSKMGMKLLVLMIQCALSNGVLDLNGRTDYGWTLINSTTKAGAYNIFYKLINFGIERDHMDIVLHAIEYGQAEFLEEFYKKFPTNMYDFFCTHCIRILASNKWAVFKYYAKKIMAEQQITLTELVNYRLPFPHTTVFHYTINHGLMELAGHLVDYVPNFDHDKNILRHSPFRDLKWNYDDPKPYQRLAMKIIEIDPTQLKSVDDANYTLCHKLVSGLRLPDLISFFTRYPDAKDIFFNCQDNVLKCIGGMIARDHFTTITYLVGNHLDTEVLYSILNDLAATKNIELFVYVMSLAKYDFVVPTKDNEYPLVTALENSNLEIFNLIWPKMKNGDLRNVFYDLLRCAIQKPGLNQIFDEILEMCSDLKNLYGRNKSLLHWSAIADNFYTAKELIKRNVLVEFDHTIVLPSDYAENVEMYDLLNLYTMQADCSLQNNENILKPLLHACVKREPSGKILKLIEHLVTTKYNVDTLDYYQRSAIYYATDTKIAACLMQFNPNLNCKDADGNTPIHYAFICGRPNVAYYLLEHGVVDYSIRNNDGWSYLRCLVTEQYDYRDLESVLSNASSKLRTHLVDYCNEPARHETPLILDALKSNNVLTNWFLQQPNLDLYNARHPYSSNTLLHVAFLYGRVDIIHILIDHGLHVNEQNDDGDTPLNLYCRHSAVICPELLRQYLKHKPDVCITNDMGMSPLLYAASKDNTGQAVCELLAHGARMEIGSKAGGVFERLAVRVQEIFKFLVD